MTSEEEIIQKLSKYGKHVRYSQFRKEFPDDVTFLDRLCLPITTGEVVACGYSKEETEFSEEVETIKKIQAQLAKTKGRRVYCLEGFNHGKDIYIICTGNMRKVYRVGESDLSNRF